MDAEDIKEGMKALLLGPVGHPLHRATGTVIRVFTADEMWKRQPMDMLGGPFSWTAGQVLISLDDPRPRDPEGRPWTPLVSVRPCDVQDASQPDVPPAREKLRELLASYAASGRVVTETTVRAELDAHGFELSRHTLHRWLAEEADRRRPDGES